MFKRFARADRQGDKWSRAERRQERPGRRERQLSRRERNLHAQAAADGFWERPALMNMAADGLLLFATLVLGYALVVSIVRLPMFALKQVVVSTPLDQVTPTQVDYAVQHALSGNFFTVDLDGIRTSFEKLPWVRTASVRRHWPDGLAIELEEHLAVARWRNSQGQMRLVNQQGEVFNAALAGSQHSLPLFGGPEGSAPQVLARYREVNQQLQPLARTARTVLLSPRHAWQLQLDDGLLLELGREQNGHALHERLARFVATYMEVMERVPMQIAAIDMRYPNGFALRPGTAVRATQGAGATTNVTTNAATKNSRQGSVASGVSVSGKGNT